MLFPLRVSAIISRRHARHPHVAVRLLPARLRRAQALVSTVCPRLAFWGIAALVLAYSAYVAEVFQQIKSIRPDQEAAARAIGLTRLQALRFVVLPQAVRASFRRCSTTSSVEKDSALMGTLGVVEALQAQIERPHRSTTRRTSLR